MKEFIKSLKDNGVKNITYGSQIGYEKKDSLTFQINDKIFIIDSMRGGEISRGSLLVCDVIDARNIDI